MATHVHDTCDICGATMQRNQYPSCGGAHLAFQNLGGKDWKWDLCPTCIGYLRVGLIATIDRFVEVVKEYRQEEQHAKQEPDPA